MQKQIAKDHKLNHEVVGAFNPIEFGHARKRSDREDEENVQIHLESQRGAEKRCDILRLRVLSKWVFFSKRIPRSKTKTI